MSCVWICISITGTAVAIQSGTGILKLRYAHRQSTVSELAFDILAFMAENADDQMDSRDTLRGIKEWWIPEIFMKKALAKALSMPGIIIESAVKELVEMGFIEACTGKDKQMHYQLNKGKSEEIRKIIKQKRDME